jgi:hypothetical protein
VPTPIDMFPWLACSSTLSLFSFLPGRCSRHLPLIDDCLLPWVMHRGLTSDDDGKPRNQNQPETATEPLHPRITTTSPIPANPGRTPRRTR